MEFNMKRFERAMRSFREGFEARELDRLEDGDLEHMETSSLEDFDKDDATDEADDAEFEIFKTKLNEFLRQNKATLVVGQGQSVIFSLNGVEFEVDEELGM